MRRRRRKEEEEKQVVGSESMILCDGDGWSGDGMFVWLRTDFPTKRVQPIPYTK